MSRIVSFILGVFVLAGLVGCSAESSTSGEIPGSRISQEQLKGGCRTVCPKCRPGQICSMMACRLECPPNTQPCGDNLCRHGQVCCNASCGICTEPDMFCTQQACEPIATCKVLALCVEGYTWDSVACECVPTEPAPTEPAPSACSTDADCRLFSDYCTGCDCRALSTTEKDPYCDGPGVRCFADPCMDHTAACVGGECVVQ